MTTIPYRDISTELEGFVAYPAKEKRPLVILCHAWAGRDEFICQKAREIADWGYVGFVLDMYGKGVVGRSNEENASLKGPFIENRHLLQKRVLKGYEVACKLPNVDTQQVAVLGFGFGGLCALDLARSGVHLKGAVSIYGHFDPSPPELVKTIKAKILILHGYNDPISPQNELKQFVNELSLSNVDWQAYLYGNTMHAFASPNANDPERGILYHSVSAIRAWSYTHQFLNEIFA